MSQVLLLIISWSEKIHLRCQVMTVLSGTEVDKLIFDFVNDFFSLRPVSVLQERLENTTPIMLVQHFMPLFTDLSETLVDDGVALMILRFFHHQFVVAQTQTVD